MSIKLQELRRKIESLRKDYEMYHQKIVLYAGGGSQSLPANVMSILGEMSSEGKATDLGDDLGEGLRIGPARDRDAHQVAAGPHQAPDLSHATVHVRGRYLGHRLDDDGDRGADSDQAG